jgi:hypothetical protein
MKNRRSSPALAATLFEPPTGTHTANLARTKSPNTPSSQDTSSVNPNKGDHKATAQPAPLFSSRSLFLGLPALPILDGKLMHDCCMSRRIKKTYKITLGEHPRTGEPLTLIGGTTVGETPKLFSFAVPFDSLRGTHNALIFPEALYDAHDVIHEIIKRARAACSAKSEESAPIIPYVHRTSWKIDDYSQFLRPFQCGVPLMTLIQFTQRMLKVAKAGHSSIVDGMSRERSIQIIQEIIKLCDELFERKNSLSQTLSAREFAEGLKVVGFTTHEIIAAAYAVSFRDNTLDAPSVYETLDKSNSAVDDELRGFARYVSRALQESVSYAQAQ